MYQRIQHRKVFQVGDLLASFVATPTDDTLFVGIYHVDGIGIDPPGTIDPIVPGDRGGMNLYEIHPEKALADYVGKLTVEGGKDFELGFNVLKRTKSAW